MKKFLFIVFYAIIISQNGCQNDKPFIKEKNKDMVFSFYNAAWRGSFAVKQGKTSPWKILSEPLPVTAKDLVQKYLGKINYESISVQSRAEIASSVVKLGELSETVLLLQSALYRLSEISFNRELSEDNIRLMFSGIMRSVENISTAQKNHSEVLKIKALGGPRK